MRDDNMTVEYKFKTIKPDKVKDWMGQERGGIQNNC